MLKLDYLTPESALDAAQDAGQVQAHGDQQEVGRHEGDLLNGQPMAYQCR